MPTMPPPANAVAPPARRRRWLRRLLFALILIGAVYLARGPLLHGIANLLIVDDPEQPVDALVLLNGDHLYEQTAKLYHEGKAQRVLLLQVPPGRLERMGIMPDPIQQARSELKDWEVPETAVEVLKMDDGGDWNRARRLRDWLNDHPEARVRILCERFSSRRTRYLFAHELGGLSARVQWDARPDRRYDETNWQHSRAGVLALFDSYLSLGHVWLYGEPQGDGEEWDPDMYQNNLP